MDLGVTHNSSPFFLLVVEVSFGLLAAATVALANRNGWTALSFAGLAGVCAAILFLGVYRTTSIVERMAIWIGTARCVL
jgi:hypothetical protein